MDAIRTRLTQLDAYRPANGPSDTDIVPYLARPEIAYTGLADIHLQ